MDNNLHGIVSTVLSIIYRHRRLPRSQRLGIALAVGASVVAFPVGPTASVLFRVFEDPWHDIVARVMAAGPSRRCVKTSVTITKYIPALGCLVSAGDTTYYFYRDSTNAAIVAGRQLQTPDTTGTIPVLRARLSHTYGTPVDCLLREGNEKHFVTDYLQWHTTNFTIQLLQLPGSYHDGRGASIYLQFVRGQSACAFVDALVKFSAHNIIGGLGHPVKGQDG